MSETKKYNRITRHLTQALAARDFPMHVRGYEMNNETQEIEPAIICMADVIQRVLTGKIISKYRVEHLERVEKDYYSVFDFMTVARLTEELEKVRREKYLTECGYQSAIAELNGARSENLKLTQENTNLKLDVAALKMYPQYVYAADWGFGTANWTATTYTPGQVISTDPCDICGIVEPLNATHGHSDFERFVRRLKFWR